MNDNCMTNSITSGGESHAKNPVVNMVVGIVADKATEWGAHPNQLREEQAAPNNRNSDGAFVQRLENLPQELLTQARWFPVREDKKPKIEGWQKPENQRLPQDVRGLKGFDTCGRGQAVDFLFLDFDHVLTDQGKFVNAEVEMVFDEIRNEFARENFFCERSISGHGLHVLLLPTEGEFDAVNAGRKGTLHFGDGGAKLEIFYGGKARYMLATGNLFCCDKGTTIAQGETVDKVFRRLLRDVQKEIDATTPTTKPQQVRPRRDDERNLREDTDEYKAFRIQRMLDTIIPAALSDTEWLAVQSACKNEGVPYSIVDAFNRRDAERYNEQENLARWNSITDSNFNIETIHGIAKRFGYDEKSVWHEFHDTTPARTSGASPLRGDRANEVLDNTETAARAEEIIGRIRDACEWRGTKDKDGNFKRISIKPTQSNLDLIFGQDPNLRGLVGYDKIQGMNVILKQAPWHDSDKTGEQWDDTDAAQLRVYLRRNYADIEHPKRIDDSLVTLSRANAFTGVKPFNAVKQFLDGLPQWDGVERAATVLAHFLHAEDSEYTRTVTMNFLIGAIARVYHPGCDFQTCLVLVGAQRIGKSKLVKMLGGKEGVNPNGQNWHVALKDSVDDSHATDALMKGWIIEIEEFSAARKAEINALKSFISANEDTRRFSYDKYATTRARHCVFVTTCNDQQFLRDPTGNARFIPVQCSKKKFDRVKGMTPAYIRQVWAEALVKYRELFSDGFNEAKLILPLEIQIQSEAIAETFTQDDGMTTEITAYLDRKIPQQLLWLLLSREERRNFFVNGHVRMFDAWEELKARRTARGGRNLQADLEQLQAICANQFGNTRNGTGGERFFYGVEYRQHICAVEVFNECFGQDKRKSMHRINEILSNMDGWTLGKRLQKLDPEYNDMKKVFYRNEDNIPVDDTEDEPADKFTGEPINPDDIPPFNPDDLPID